MKIFGDYIEYTNADNEKIPVSVYMLGLQHLTEDFGRTIYAEEIIEYCSNFFSKKTLGFNPERAMARLVSHHKGIRSDYEAIQAFFHHFEYWSKNPVAKQTGLAFINNSFGIFQLEKLYGPVWTRPSDGRIIPTRILGENYVSGGYGKIPTLNQIVEEIPQKSWMYVNAAALSKQFEDPDSAPTKIRVAPSPLPLDDTGERYAINKQI